MASRYPLLSPEPMQTIAEQAVRPVDVTVWFETDSTNNPSVFSPGIESVTRQTADTSSEVFYRVKLSKDFRVTDYHSASPSIAGSAAAAVLVPMVRTGFEISSVAAVSGQEIDISVYDVVGAAFTTSIDGPRISIRVVYDALGGRP